MRQSVLPSATQTHSVIIGPSGILFGSAILLSSFLLFVVQPLIGRYILPWFGGSAGVWTTCLMFFQVVLLAGYLYAHLSTRLLKPPMQALVHLALLAGAIALLPIAPGPRYKPAAAEPTWQILRLLAVCVGAPYFVLSATGPLLQAWVARMRGGEGPYRLYALSNFGSLLALGAYPFLIEPAWSRSRQATLWSWALGAFACICALCAIATWRMRSPSPAIDPADDHGREQVPRMYARLMWVLLPGCASVLLLAVNNVICREIAVVPFLWVLPLGLYLLSFILCFEGARWYHRGVFIPASLLAAGALIHLLIAQPRSIVLAIAVHCAVLFVFCMICHGELARLKPPARSLTTFYLLIAWGGAMGGLFVGLAAPLMFAGCWELHLCIACCFLLLLIAIRKLPGAFFLRRFGRACWHGLALSACVAAIFLYVHTRGAIRGERLIFRTRDFFGTFSIYEHFSPPSRALHHGGIVHGRQLLDPDARLIPVTYYGQSSGLRRAFDQLPERPRRIGALGLGIGTIAAYGRPGDSICFYEIDPRIERIARDYFTFLRECPAEVRVVIGDGRLSLEAETPADFDLLVLDAFSGDAIPIHLLTREAFEVYLRRLRPDGILAIHITNRHLRLYPPLRRLADHFGLQCVWHTLEEPTGFEYASDWLLMSRRALDASEAVQVASPPPASSLWTDDSTSLLPILK